MTQLIENTYLAYEQFMEGELNQYDLASLIEEGIISEELLDSIMEEAYIDLSEDELCDEDYYDEELEEGKLWSQWRAHRNEKAAEKAIRNDDMWKAHKKSARSIERTEEVLKHLNKRKEKLDKKKGAKIRKWWTNKQLDKHNKLLDFKKAKMDKMFTRIR